MYGFKRLAGSVLVACTVFAYAFAFQGSRSLWEPDEGRYTNIAAQMLRTGDFIVPAFNDDVPHFAKPPLTYWAIAGGIALLGWNEWGARLANALAFTATVLVIFALARKTTPDRPWLPPLIYATFLMPFVATNIVTTDTLLTLWEAVAVLGFMRWWERRDAPGLKSDLFLMWCGFGLAFMTKGPPGVLPLAAILAFVVLMQGWRAVHRVARISGVLAFVIVGLGWYLFVAATHPGLMTYFVRDEISRRMTSSAFNRNAEWYGAFRVYLPALVGGTLPWTFSWLRAARSLPRTLLSRTWWRGKLEQDPWSAFLALWVLLPLVAFALSRSRLPLYVLPLFVPLALATGKLLGDRPVKRVSAYLLTAWLVVLVALKWGVSYYPTDRESRSLARFIATHAASKPAEVVFVDIRPVWGLSLYLRCEVERVTSFVAATTGTAPEETLVEELAEGESRILLVIAKDRAAEVKALLDRPEYFTHEIVDMGSWMLVAPIPAADRPSPGAPSLPRSEP